MKTTVQVVPRLKLQEGSKMKVSTQTEKRREVERERERAAETYLSFENCLKMQPRAVDSRPGLAVYSTTFKGSLVISKYQLSPFLSPTNLFLLELGGPKNEERLRRSVVHEDVLRALM